MAKRREDHDRAISLRIEQLDSRISRLTDAFLDGDVERPLFGDKKLALHMERKQLEEERRRLEQNAGEIAAKIGEYLELAKKLPLGYEIGNPDEKRDFVKSITSNLTADEKYLAIELRSPFLEVENLSTVRSGGPLRGSSRTFAPKLFKMLVEHFATGTSKETADGHSVAA